MPSIEVVNIPVLTLMLLALPHCDFLIETTHSSAVSLPGSSSRAEDCPFLFSLFLPSLLCQDSSQFKVGFPGTTHQYFCLCLFLSPHITLLVLKAGGSPRFEGASWCSWSPRGIYPSCKNSQGAGEHNPKQFLQWRRWTWPPLPARSQPLCAVRGYCVQLRQSVSLKKKLCIWSPRQQRTFIATPSFRLGFDERTGYYSQDT